MLRQKKMLVKGLIKAMDENVEAEEGEEAGLLIKGLINLWQHL